MDHHKDDQITSDDETDENRERNPGNADERDQDFLSIDIKLLF